MDKPSAAETAAPTATSKVGLIVKVLLAVVVVVGLFLLARRGTGYVEQFAAWVEGLGIWGPVIFAAGYALFTIAMIPGSFLTLAAGALFGFQGVIWVFLGATAGACGAFLIARYLARGAVEKKLEGNEKFAAIDKAVAEQGRKIVFLLRLSPVFPFTLLNYGLGLTRVRFIDYAIASIGMLPGTFLYVYSGKAAGDLASLASGTESGQGAGTWIVLGIGLLATLVVTVFVTRIASRALKEATE